MDADEADNECGHCSGMESDSSLGLLQDPQNAAEGHGSEAEFVAEEDNKYARKQEALLRAEAKMAEV